MSAAPYRRRFRGSDPRRNAVGWGVVVAVHALIGWALVSGTGRKHLDIVNKPMQANVIQEVTIPPPPPPTPPTRIEPPKPPPPRPAPRKKVEAPKPPPRAVEPAPYVPPPEVTRPPSPAAVAAPSTPLPPSAPPVAAAAPPAPPVAAAPAPPSRQDMTVACPEQVRPEIPRRALRDGTEGVVKAQAVIRDGVVKEVTILSGPRVYHAPVREAMLQYKCVGAGEVIATQEFVFKID